MARKTKEWEAFGVLYRTQEFSAAFGFEQLDKEGQLPDFEPNVLLAGTEVRTEDCSWSRLDSPRNIDLYVRDVLGRIDAHIVLKSVMNIVWKLNWEFLIGWKPHKIPRRFALISDINIDRRVEPRMGRILNDELATLRELEEYYSLRDAFKMYDLTCEKALDELLTNEAAQREAKAKAKSAG